MSISLRFNDTDNGHGSSFEEMRRCFDGTYLGPNSIKDLGKRLLMTVFAGLIAVSCYFSNRNYLDNQVGIAPLNPRVVASAASTLDSKIQNCQIDSQNFGLYQ